MYNTMTVHVACSYSPIEIIFSGFASRQCSESGWASVNLIGCISTEGRGLLFQVGALEDGGQILTLPEIEGVADTLRRFIGDRGNISGGDVHVAGRLLSQLIAHSEDLGVSTLLDREGVEDSIQSLLQVGNLLLNPDLSEEWMGNIEEVGFDSEDFLFALEMLSRVIGTVGMPTTSTQYSLPNILIRREPWQPLGLQDTRLELQWKVSSSIAVRSSNATPPSYVTFMLLPTLGFLLIESADFNISQMTLATPIFSVQAASTSGSDVTEVAIDMTLEYTQAPIRLDVVGMAVCVAWGYQGR